MAVAAAADLLGDTPSVTRAAYIHPNALAADRDESMAAAVRDASERAGTRDVSVLLPDDGLQRAVLLFLRSLPSDQASPGRP